MATYDTFPAPDCRFFPTLGHLLNLSLHVKLAVIVAIYICGDRPYCVISAHVLFSSLTQLQPS